MEPQGNVAVPLEAVSEGTACALCGTTQPDSLLTRVNGQPACRRCTEQLQNELATEKPAMLAFPLAAAGGIVGALLGAGVWAAIAVLGNLEVGYVAVLVGFLAGWGVKLGAGGARSQNLQFLAAGISVLGLLAAKYFTFAHYFAAAASEEGAELGMFSLETMRVFPQLLVQMLSPFDLLWLAIALAAAYKVPAPTQLKIEG